jgi:hypothetical protein
MLQSRLKEELLLLISGLVSQGRDKHVVMKSKLYEKSVYGALALSKIRLTGVD